MLDHYNRSSMPMASTSSECTNNANLYKFTAKLQKLTREQTNLSQTKMANSASNKSSSISSNQSELDQWHKLMSDYERLQLVASSKAHNKLIRSSSESSLGSSSNLSQASTVVMATTNNKIEESRSQVTQDTQVDQKIKRPTSMIARYNSSSNNSRTLHAAKQDGGRHGQQVPRENSSSHVSEVGKCLNDLVESVVAAVNTQEAPSGESQPPEASCAPVSSAPSFRSFKLHEAILAKTLSSSSSDSSSSSSGDEAPAPPDKSRVCTSAQEAEVAVNEFLVIGSLGQFTIDKKDALDRQQLIYALREFSCARQDSACSSPDELRATFDNSKPEASAISWTDSNNNAGHLEIGQIIECEQDDELIVWLLAPSCRDGTSNQDTSSSSGSGHDDALDLDDIALALNEPVASKSSSALSALVWSCASSGDAKKLRDFWFTSQRSQLISTAAGNDASAERHHQIEVRPCEVAANSKRAAEQIKSSGLFVLQPATQSGSVGTSERPDIQEDRVITQVVRENTKQIREQNKQQQVAVTASALTKASRPKSMSAINLAKSLSSSHGCGGSSSSGIPSIQTKHQTEGANLLANYYRNVTSRMAGNSNSSGGSSRLKNFTQEMSKLNGRGQTTLVKSARRLSMALNHLSHSTSGGSVQSSSLTNSSTSSESVALQVPPVVRPRTSILKATTTATAQAASGRAVEQKISDKKEAARDQEASLLKTPISEHPAAAAAPRSILKKAVAQQPPTRDERSAVTARQQCDTSSTVEHRTRQQQQQRASCFNIASSHTADNSDAKEPREKTTLTLEKQRDLLKLRAGSTSSIASKSRQRRPALLLSNDNEDNDKDKHQKLVMPPADGMARASVSMSHLRRSTSMKALAVAAPATKDAKHGRTEMIYAEAAEHSAPPAPNYSEQRKKSEFDPRSLRKLTNSEAAQALREGADFEASYEDRKLRREKARRRRSMANLGELKGELDADCADKANIVAREVIATEKSEVPKAAKQSSGGQSLSKSFTLLRQSFRQKNFSSMLGLSSRASLRVVDPSEKQLQRAPEGSGQITTATAADDDDEEEQDKSSEQQKQRLKTNKQTDDQQISALVSKQKLEAIRLAEANLLAAKQLKQQAQRLREQQKRSEHQSTSQQQANAESAAILFHNQQIHKQQQQQLIYQQQQQQQQQFSFDPLNFQQLQLQQQQHQLYQAQQFRMQQQQQQQRHQQLQLQHQQQQQQLAYLSSSSSSLSSHSAAAHFMAVAAHHAPMTLSAANHFGAYGAPTAALSVAPIPSYTINALHQQQQQPPPPAQLINHLRTSNTGHNRYLYQPQPAPTSYMLPAPSMSAPEPPPLQHQGPFIPMSVNHHSSFNIVYTATSANQQQHQQHYQRASHNFAPPPHHQSYSSGASTMSPQIQAQLRQQYAQPILALEAKIDDEPQQSTLRSKHSSLGASVRKTMRSVLSNGKAASTRAAAKVAVPELHQSAQQVTRASKPLKSALKTSSMNGDEISVDESSDSSSCEQQQQQQKISSPSHSSSSPLSLSSSSSPSSSDSSLASSGSTRNVRKSLERLRKEFIEINKAPPSAAAASAQSAAHRKNVTFSTKLTSIL